MQTQSTANNSIPAIDRVVAVLDKCFQRYIQSAVECREKPMDERKALIEKHQQDILRIINSNSNNDSDELTFFKLLIGGLVYYIRNAVTGESENVKTFCDIFADIVKNNELYMRLPIQNELYDKYFIACMMIAKNVLVNTYSMQQNQSYLEYLLKCRQCLERYVSKRDNQTDSYTISAQYMLMTLCYEYNLTKFRMKDKTNTALGMLFDRSAFEKYYKKFGERLAERGASRSSEEDCFAYLLEAYQSNIDYTKELLRSDKSKFNFLNVDFLRHMSIFMDVGVLKFLQKRSAERTSNSFFQIPEFRLGCNLYAELTYNVMRIMAEAQEQLDHIIEQYEIDEIKSNPSHPSWNYLHAMLNYQRALIVSGLRIVSHRLIRDFLTADKIQSNAVQATATVYKINVLIGEMDQSKEDFIKKQNQYIAGLHQESLTRQKFRSISKKKPAKHNTKADFATKKSNTSTKKMDPVETENEVECDEIEAVAILIRHRKFPEAITRYRALIDQEEKNGDYRRLIYLYMCLGDAYYHQATFIDKPKQKKATLNLAEKNYKKCVAMIDEKTDELNDDEQMKDLKSFIQDLLVLIAENSRSKSVQAAPASVENSTLENEPLFSDTHSEASSTSSTLSMQISPPSSPPATLMLPAMSFYTYQMIVPDYVNHVMNTLIKCGYDVYLVGGCVRDSLLGQEANDFDMATNAPWNVIDILFAQLGKIVGANHPVCLIDRYAKNIQITSMKAIKLGNNPKLFQMSDGTMMTYQCTSSIAEDALARDFTCNALYYSPLNNLIFDTVNGFHHTMAKKIVFINQPSSAINSDPSLILRSSRLMIRSGFTVDRELDEIMCSYVPLLNRMNPIRLRQELDKTKQTVGNDATKQALMKRYGLLQLDSTVSSCDQVLFDQRTNTDEPKALPIPVPTPGDIPGSFAVNGVTYYRGD